jgi:hypothetical protein
MGNKCGIDLQKLLQIIQTHRWSQRLSISPGAETPLDAIPTGDALVNIAGIARSFYQRTARHFKSSVRRWSQWLIFQGPPKPKSLSSSMSITLHGITIVSMARHFFNNVKSFGRVGDAIILSGLPFTLQS